MKYTDQSEKSSDFMSLMKVFSSKQKNGCFWDFPSQYILWYRFENCKVLYMTDSTKMCKIPSHDEKCKNIQIQVLKNRDIIAHVK